MNRTRTTFIVAFAILVAGCVSTQKRFEKGVTAKQEGKYEEAMDYFIKVLKKELYE